LKLKYYEPVLNVAFNYNLRPYILEPQLVPPLSPCGPAKMLTLPFGVGPAFAASPLTPLMMAYGCARDMRWDDAVAHAFLLRVDGALATGLKARRAAVLYGDGGGGGGSGSSSSSGSFAALRAAATLAPDLPKQLMWAGDSPTSAASAQAAAVQVMPGRA